MAQADLNYVNMLKDVQKNELLIQELFSKTLEKMIVMERKNFVFTTLAKKISIPRKQGTKTWTVKRYLHLPVDLEKGKLVEGVAPTPLKVEGVKVSASIDQYGAYIEETDVAEALHFDNIMSIYQPDLARHAAETVERNIIANLGDSSVRFVGSATDVDDITSADVLTFSDARRAWLTMKNYNREGHPAFGGAPVLVAHINVMQDLIDDDVLKDYIIVPGYDESPIKSGSLTQFKLYDMNFVETRILTPVENTTGVNVYTSYLLGKDSFALLDLQGGVSWHQKGFKEDSVDPLAQRATLGYKLWTGAKVLDPMAIFAIKSASAYDSSLMNVKIDSLARSATQTHEDIEVLHAPDKVTYATTDTALDLTGLVIAKVDNYGGMRVIKEGEASEKGAYVVSTPTFTAGTKTVTVTYTRLDDEVEGSTTTDTATFTVTVA